MKVPLIRVSAAWLPGTHLFLVLVLVLVLPSSILKAFFLPLSNSSRPSPLPHSAFYGFTYLRLPHLSSEATWGERRVGVSPGGGGGGRASAPPSL